MTLEEREKVRDWVENWKVTGEILKRLRVKEFSRSDRANSILSLSDASEFAIRAYPPKPTSGLIEMQRLFRALPKQ